MESQTLSHTAKLGRLARYPLKLVPSTMVVPVLTGKLRGKRSVVGSWGYELSSIGNRQSNGAELFAVPRAR
jgi:hypothetical protein